MGVKIRKRSGKWYVFVNHRGMRKARCIGTSREAAEQVRREIEQRLALGTFRIDAEAAKRPTFREYTEQWMAHVRANLKRSTSDSYQGILNSHLLPRFGHLHFDAISRKELKSYIVELADSGKLARNTVRNVFASLRAIFTQAVEDELIEMNPAIRLGRFNHARDRVRQVEFLTREEAEQLLATAKEFCPARYPLFMTGLRAGLRLGELLALQWDSIQFGLSESDPNRHILVRRNIVRGEQTDPKNHKSRRVDMSKELRAVLIELRDRAMLRAMERGEWDERGQPGMPKFVFPSDTGGPLDGSNVYHRDFLPCLEAAGLRHVTFHALRHTFASLLIQGGASLVYVKEQMGHSSIQVTVDTYGHLIPGGNIAWIDGLDSRTSPQGNATPAQTRIEQKTPEDVQVVQNHGAGERNRTSDLRFTKPLLYRLSYAGC